MVMSLTELQQKVRAQKDLIPSLYGDVAFIAAMENVPDWLDMNLVNKGARVYCRL